MTEAMDAATKFDYRLFKAEVPFWSRWGLFNKLKEAKSEPETAGMLESMLDRDKRLEDTEMGGQHTYTHTTSGASKVAYVLSKLGRRDLILRGVVAYDWHDAAKASDLITDEFLTFNGHPFPAHLNDQRVSHARNSAQMAREAGIDKKYDVARIIEGSHYYASEYGFDINNPDLTEDEKLLTKVVAMVDFQNAATHYHAKARPAISQSEAAAKIGERFDLKDTDNERVYNILFPRGLGGLFSRNKHKLSNVAGILACSGSLFGKP
jgi:hypothetical protein